MRLVPLRLLLAAIVAIGAVTAIGCGSGATPAPDDVRVRVRLENQDPHLYDVATVDLDLRRDNVVVHDTVGDPAHPLGFPTEVIIKVPIGAGTLAIEATPRSSSGLVLGGGEGTVTATSGSIASVTVGLLSDRNRPSRGHGGSPDGGAEPDARVEVVVPPDASSATPDGAETDAAPGTDAAAEGAAPACTPRMHRLVAQAVVSVDYGSLPRDREDTRVSVSSGLAHNHVHAFVGWMRFDLSSIPAGATLRTINVGLVLTTVPTAVPHLALEYSANDHWDPESLTSDTAELVPRTARVSGDLGPPHNARFLYPVDVGAYQRYWAGDLGDHAVTLGMVSTTPPDQPETWADFYGLDPDELAPVLELETCE
jgi:hypothetical protein